MSLHSLCFWAFLGGNLLQPASSGQESIIRHFNKSVYSLVASTEKLDKSLNKLMDALHLAGGSTYIRWGRVSCPKDNLLIYTGFAAGSHHSRARASNRLCLHREPEFPDFTVDNRWTRQYASIYGAEYKNYEFIPQKQDKTLKNQDVPCAVCMNPHAVTIMVPGRITCPHPSWKMQYFGYLSSHDSSDEGWADYVCMDSEPEALNHGTIPDDQHYFQPVVFGDNSIPADFPKKTPISCVVCSK